MHNLKDELNGAVILETPRLICRRWLRSDFETIFRTYSDPEVCRWIDDGQPITREESMRWLDVTAKNYLERGYGMFALEERDNSDTVGFCGLVHPGGQLDAEIKYAFQRPYWGRGFAGELIPSVLVHAADAFMLRKVIATVAPGNVASQRVLLKSGFVFVEDRIDGGGSPEQLYEWHADRQGS